MSSCTTSPNQKFVGSCETTHERVCGFRSGVGGQLGAVTQTNPRFGLTCKSEGYKSLYDGKEKGIGEKPL